MSLPAIVFAAARRTPIGSLNGMLSSMAAHELGAVAIRAALADARVAPEDVDEVILGQVLTAAQGMNPGRQASRAAGLPDAAPAALVNQVCGSGLRAVALAAQQIETGGADIVVAGGQESMSRAPHAAFIRQGRKLGDLQLRDTVMTDGLADAFYGYPMGATAENVARRYQLSRQTQDEFALASQRKASAAAAEGRFADEITPVAIAGRKGLQTFTADEHIRHDASSEAMAALRPAFADDGTVTAGNASGINDGAAALVLMTEAEAERRGLAPLGRIAAWAHAGVDPQVMGLGPIPASRNALERAGWQLGDVDLWEINEAFAAQSLAVISDLGLESGRVNVNGGAIALGHPIGASGARVLTTLLHEMRRRKARRGVATLCIGGGMGIAMAVEHV
ncbi:MAG: acetyl-CoA acetyltransferase [Devosia sp. 67-54]|uniref:acetyl-CoA C-acetyltransferase n=1 Tax=unclassified Devosia TaxID=196773 RepID=UPI000964C3C2|nr:MULTISPECIES: acetyl-CoA C-acetyltransferase [unclassified Devosia]MBN9306690.1 acetyl-CoA C-acetyltransferase [Devosia sp.]OJX15963.1 MAG: acetyl-CoA acetyltransferase [Devosia sp. 67-54]